MEEEDRIDARTRKKDPEKNNAEDDKASEWTPSRDRWPQSYIQSRRSKFLTKPEGTTTKSRNSQLMQYGLDRNNFEQGYSRKLERGSHLNQDTENRQRRSSRYCLNAARSGSSSVSDIDAYEEDMMRRCGISKQSGRNKASGTQGGTTYENDELKICRQFKRERLGKGSHTDVTHSANMITANMITDGDDSKVAAENDGSFAGSGYFKNEKILVRDLHHLNTQLADNIIRIISQFFTMFVVIFNKYDISSEEVKLLLASLSKGCQTRKYSTHLLKILNEVKESRLMKTATPSLLFDIKTANIDKDTLKTVLNILILLRCIATYFPNSITLVFGLDTALQRALNKIKHRCESLDEDLLKEMRIFSDIKSTMVERMEKEKQKARKPRRKINPPDDFRSLSVFPQLEDINTREVPFLRKNKKVGGYDDIDDYLDTQFRLLREDFVQPLRDGIKEYLDFLTNPRIRKTIRIYSGVSIQQVVWSKDKILHKLKFDVTKFPHVKWEYSKRLIYGTLLCLSFDNFQTFYLATVAESDRVSLNEGLVDVKFQLAYDEMENIAERGDFVMIETPAYFEAYKHVLKALQTIDDDMPFAKYIVNCETKVKTPLYLRNSCIDFTEVMSKMQQSTLHENFKTSASNLTLCDSDNCNSDSDSSISNSDNSDLVIDTHVTDNDHFFINATESQTIHEQQWPNPGELLLNNAQYKAFKEALSKEFCIIQGPPGTGKTYLGLKIVQTLLGNLNLWHDTDDGKKKSPILLVCYTNHALDQFMEGISKFIDKNDMDSIVRIGSRSQNQALERFNIKNKRDALRTRKELPNLQHERRDILHQLEVCQMQICKCGSNTDVLSNGIVHEDVLRPFMGHHFFILTGRFDNRQSNPAILNWLGFGNLTHCCHKRINKTLDPDIINADEYFKENTELIEREERMFALTFREIKRERDGEPENEGTKDKRLRQMSKAKKDKLREKLKNKLQMKSKLDEDKVNSIDYIWNMSHLDRWRLYHYWLQRLQEFLKKKKTADMKQHLSKFNEKVHDFEEISNKINCHILQSAKVIGMTTTGAARSREILKTVAPRIVIIEEAAEVLESHTVTSVYPGCEHLVLIGDHQQLRPNPNVYLLAKRYNLDISLFERMANNGHRTNTLTLQHRMRPSISRLLRHIYLKLEDHPSVDEYEDIKGVSKNVYFINHSEKEMDDEDSHIWQSFASICFFRAMNSHK